MSFDYYQDYGLETQKQLIDKFKKICICRGITAGSIMKAIEGGALSFEALKRTIGTGTGNCKARRCRHKIVERVNDYKKAMKAAEPESSEPETTLPS